jgi:hypothetical protein
VSSGEKLGGIVVRTPAANGRSWLCEVEAAKAI